MINLFNLTLIAFYTHCKVGR